MQTIETRTADRARTIARRQARLLKTAERSDRAFDTVARLSIEPRR